jgi:hypothetical protein
LAALLNFFPLAMAARRPQLPKHLALTADPAAFSHGGHRILTWVEWFIPEPRHSEQKKRSCHQRRAKIDDQEGI